MFGLDVSVQGRVAEVGLPAGAGEIPALLVLAGAPGLLLLLVVGFLFVQVLRHAARSFIYIIKYTL